MKIYCLTGYDQRKDIMRPKYEKLFDENIDVFEGMLNIFKKPNQLNTYGWWHPEPGHLGKPYLFVDAAYYRALDYLYWKCHFDHPDVLVGIDQSAVVITTLLGEKRNKESTLSSVKKVILVNSFDVPSKKHGPNHTIDTDALILSPCKDLLEMNLELGKYYRSCQHHVYNGDGLPTDNESKKVINEFIKNE